MRANPAGKYMFKVNNNALVQTFFKSFVSENKNIAVEWSLRVAINFSKKQCLLDII